MANNNQIYKMSNAGGFKSLTRYYDMLAGNTTWSPWAPAGAYDALATVTVPSGGAASIEFAGIPTGYKHLQIRAIGKVTSTATSGDDRWFCRFNGDTGNNYTTHMMYGVGTGSVYAYSNVNTNYMMPYGIPFSQSNDAWGPFIMDVLDYASTSKLKTSRFLAGYSSSVSADTTFSSALWNSTSAITSITFTPPDGNFSQYTNIALYGIK